MRKKVLLNCLDMVGSSMAGPAIRYWEFAHALSKNYQVLLRTPNETNLTSTKFSIIQGPIPFSEIDIIITQIIDEKMAFDAKRHGIRLIYDAYDPEPLEHLEIFKPSEIKTRRSLNHSIVSTINFNLEMCDAVICANHKQRDLWMGALLSLKKISPDLYDRDETLYQYLGIAPFGIPSKPAVKTKDGFRERFSIASTDKLLLWGGGIWNWFDPLTLIHAIKKLSEERSDIKLVFMGIKHPNPTIPLMSMAAKALQLAHDLGIKDRFVFFNEQWIPYDERENYLLDADIGVSTHFEHLETQYSFRTRLLDYIWTGLPVIATEGDVFAEVVTKHAIGSVVPAKSVEALVEAIRNLVDHPEKIQQMKKNIALLREQYVWEKAVHAIEKIIESFAKRESSKMNRLDFHKIFKFTIRKYFSLASIKKWIARRKHVIKT